MLLCTVGWNGRTPATGLPAGSHQRPPRTCIPIRDGTEPALDTGSDQQGLKAQVKRKAWRTRLHGAGRQCITRPLDGMVEYHRAGRNGRSRDASSSGRQGCVGFDKPAIRQVVRRIIRRLSAACSARRPIWRLGKRLGLVPTTGHAAALRPVAGRGHGGGENKQGQKKPDRFGCR